jgi:SPP1 gp7 family putative phage head morphogenesis protein
MIKSLQGEYVMAAKPVELSKATGIDYNAELQRIVRAVRKDVNAEVMPVVRIEQSNFVTDAPWLDRIIAALKRIRLKYSGPQYDSYASHTSAEFVEQANRVNKKRFNESMKKSFGIDVFGDSPDLVAYLEASVYDNVQLIESIPGIYLDRVESIIMTNIRAGNRSSAIAKQLTQQFGIEARRAKFIAVDQTGKINGDLNVKRQTSVGFIYFYWLTSKDQRVRTKHTQISEKVTAYGKGIYRWDKPPIGDEGTPIIPGQAYNCRCVGLAVADWEVKENQDEKKVSPGVYR